MIHTLNPDLWDENGRLKPAIQNSLTRLVERFIQDSELQLDVHDIILLGGATSPRHSTHDELEIHILSTPLDQELNGNLESWQHDVKHEWHSKVHHSLLGHTVNICLRNPSEEHFTNTAYSISKGRWIQEPDEIVPHHPQEIESTAKRWMAFIDHSMKKAKDEYEIQNLQGRVNQMGQAPEDSFSGKVFNLLNKKGYLSKLHLRKHRLKNGPLKLPEVI